MSQLCYQPYRNFLEVNDNPTSLMFCHFPQTWFSNRRQRWRKKQAKELVGLSGHRPTLPSSLVIQSSGKKTFWDFNRCTENPVLRQVPLQTFSSQSYPMNNSLLPASELQLPCQRIYQSLSPTRSKYFPETEQQSSTQCGFPTYQPTYPDPELPTQDYPFSYSIAKELPHIFGNVDEDEVLERPLTPSFEPTNEFDFADVAHFVPPNDSYCYGNIMDFSCGNESQRNNFYRQE